MLAGHKQEILTELVTGSSKEELLWINGFIAGLLNGKELPEIAVPAAFPSRLTLVYGTETGNSKRIATEFAAKAKKKQFPVKLASLDQYRLTDLSKEENLCVVISTQGDGEPPIAAQKFYDHIHHNGFRLDNVKFSVLALGDSSYPMFCKTGEDVDAQLQKLGGKRLVPIRKCDVDFEADANDWFEEVLKTVQNRPGNLQAGLPVTKVLAETKANKKIYHANILSNNQLTDRGSSQKIWHMEIQAAGVDYEPGDSVGIVPENPLSMVNEIIRLTGIDPGKKLDFKDGEHTVQVLLHKKLAITHLHERVIKKYAGIVQQEIPELKADLKSLLELYPVKNAAMFEEVIQALPPQSPRIYTLASSVSVNRDEVHLTVEEDRFMVNGLRHTGLCSAYLSALQADDTISFFVQKNKRFRLPAKEQDIIMIGAGTGIAAFRSFLMERDAIGAGGRNWLFFGEKNFTTDFLYQTEIQDWFQTGLLTRVSLAFSAGITQEKYVQNKMLAQAKELYEWIKNGAFIYVCGQKAPMSIEVEKALLKIFETEAGTNAEAALQFFNQLKETGRYSKDVY
ncbi:MAG: hypothetical protein RLZZ28_2744 [Bacteroidota bacterium]